MIDEEEKDKERRGMALTAGQREGRRGIKEIGISFF